MSLFSPLVLIAAALVSAPALWGSVAGHQDLDVGLTRYLLSVLLCWLGASLLAQLVGPVPVPASARNAAAAESGPADEQ